LNSTNSKIPVLYGLDAVIGAGHILKAALFPHNIALAATFNESIVERVGYTTGRDSRTVGINYALAPVADVGVEPRWGRFYETYGDSPFVVTKMVRAILRGLHGTDASDRFWPANSALVASATKHFLGYGQPNGGEDRADATISDWQLERYHLRPFLGAFEEKTHSVMLNSGSVNGVPGHANKKYNVDLLKGKLNYPGFTVSDFQDVQRLIWEHNVAPDFVSAIKLALDAGLDLDMVPLDFSWADQLYQLVTSGQIPESRLDDSVRRILKVKQDLGLFDNPFPYKDRLATIGSADDYAFSQYVAEEAITLLKNQDNILPLDTSQPKKVLITGPAANSLKILAGAWAVHWQGAIDDSELLGQGSTLYEAFNEYVQDKNAEWTVNWAVGMNYTGPLSDYDNAMEMARDSDLIILTSGEPPYAEMYEQIDDLTLYEEQLNYIDQLSALGKPIILILVQGRPRLFASAIDKVNAIIYAYIPGAHGAKALTNIIFGEVNPSGRLPFAYPTATGQLAYQYGSYAHNVQWPFGYGLSYTTFTYSNFRVPDAANVNSTMQVAVDVTNSGSVSGKETVFLYVAELFAYPDEQYIEMVHGFQKVALNPGDTTTVVFSLQNEDFANVGYVGQDKVVNVRVNDQKGSFTLTPRNADGSVPLDNTPTKQVPISQTPNTIITSPDNPSNNHNDVSSASRLIASLFVLCVLLV
jgi:beta-glucosidase